MQVKEGLYRCHQCGGDFKLEDFNIDAACCYECENADFDAYEDPEEDDDDYYEEDYI